MQKGAFTGIPEFLDSGRKSWTLDSGRWTLDAGLWTLGSGRWVLDPELWTLDSGPWTLDAGFWTLDSGLWTLDFGCWTLDSGRWTLDADHWMRILRMALILYSQSWRVSESRNDTLIILQTKNRADTFFFFFLTHYLHKKKKFNLKTYNSTLLDIYGISVGEKLKKIL